MQGDETPRSRRRFRGTPSSEWRPLRPQKADIERVAKEVAAAKDIQNRLLENHPDLKTRDRVAHQYQVAGGRVELRVGEQLTANLEGVGLFEPGSMHVGIGRVSTGLGYPHLESDPDFLGLMLAFMTKLGRRVDFLGINDPTAPTDDHREFMKLLIATGESAGTEVPFGDLGERDLPALLGTQTKFATTLVRELGLRDGLKTLGHVFQQTSRTLRSSTAHQTYWTGIAEVGGAAGKFVIAPAQDEDEHPGARPGERHLTEEWKKRQAAGAIEFHLFWTPFIDEMKTPTEELTEEWEERRHLVGTVSFPQEDLDSEHAKLWATLAAEMGANPGNWVADRDDTIPHPGTELGLARSIAYRESQKGRDALPDELLEEVFTTGAIGKDLAAELRRRRREKAGSGHLGGAPSSS